MVNPARNVVVAGQALRASYHVAYNVGDVEQLKLL
jgi:hypothetical protein